MPKVSEKKVTKKVVPKAAPASVGKPEKKALEKKTPTLVGKPVEKKTTKKVAPPQETQDAKETEAHVLKSGELGS
jgi:hypothetical protein